MYRASSSNAEYYVQSTPIGHRKLGGIIRKVGQHFFESRKKMKAAIVYPAAFFFVLIFDFSFPRVVRENAPNVGHDAMTGDIRLTDRLPDRRTV